MGTAAKVAANSWAPANLPTAAPHYVATRMVVRISPSRRAESPKEIAGLKTLLPYGAVNRGINPTSG